MRNGRYNLGSFTLFSSEICCGRDAVRIEWAVLYHLKIETKKRIWTDENENERTIEARNFD